MIRMTIASEDTQSTTKLIQKEIQNWLNDTSDIKFREKLEEIGKKSSGIVNVVKCCIIVDGLDFGVDIEISFREALAEILKVVDFVVMRMHFNFKISEKC